MAYVPDPTDVTQPTEDKFAKTAAAEFRALKAYVQTIVSGGGLGVATPGQIAAFAGNTPLPGWLELDGSLQLRSTFPALWAAAQALGNVVTEASWVISYGAFSSGDLVSNFRLPDFRGIFLRGWNHGRVGANLDAGRAIGTSQAPTYIGDNGGNGGTIVAIQSGSNIANPDDTSSFSAPFGTVAPTGGGGASIVAKSARPINAAVMYCVKT